MHSSIKVSRRRFVKSAAVVAAAAAGPHALISHALASTPGAPLQQFGYGDVDIHSPLHEQQFEEHLTLLMSLSDDSLLKPLREMIGKPAPGEELGGWYRYDPKYDYHTWDAGFAPACTFGQWVSALARMYAVRPKPEIREKVLRLNRLYAETIDGKFYENNRFPAYCHDKILLGLIDSHELVQDPDAFAILERTTDAALPHLPGKAIEHGKSWRPNTDESYTWDESYTNSENLFLAYQRGAGERYKKLGADYLADYYYDPLSENHSNLNGRHAYSHVNSLSSAMQAYLTLGSEKHLRAAKNAFVMLTDQSYATGGWGPDETLRAPGSPDLFNSLSNTHSSFETPCGSYAHFKLTRYLLRVTGDSTYGDSMERMMYNTILGAKPMHLDGRTFYYADCNNKGRKVYSNHRWPCCSGTMPQVAADYRINTYFRDAQGVYANLYIPSKLRFTQDGARIEMTQRSSYPFESAIEFEIQTSKAAEFSLNLRIPAWASGASVAVNGRKVESSIAPGSFATVQRGWKSGDRVGLELPLRSRLEAIDSQHADVVALLAGPLVLFPITEVPLAVTRNQLLSAKKVGSQEWRAETAAGPAKLVPFTAIEEEQYSTYSKVS